LAKMRGNVAAYQGSRGHLLDLLDRPTWKGELNAILEPVGGLLSGTARHVPIGSHQPEEWGLARFLKEHCKETMDDLQRFSTWWVQQGTPPTWDLICECLIEGRPGILLVEAKAHENEMHREGKLISVAGLEASPEQVSARLARSLVNHGYIGRCIDEARDALRRFLPEIAISRDSNYQLSNRIASTWKVADCGMPVVLLCLGFSGDYGMTSEHTSRGGPTPTPTCRPGKVVSRKRMWLLGATKRRRPFFAGGFFHDDEEDQTGRTTQYGPDPAIASRSSSRPAICRSIATPPSSCSTS
jgi:hypothetical protein